MWSTTHTIRLLSHVREHQFSSQSCNVHNSKEKVELFNLVKIKSIMRDEKLKRFFTLLILLLLQFHLQVAVKRSIAFENAGAAQNQHFFAKSLSGCSSLRVVHLKHPGWLSDGERGQNVCKRRFKPAKAKSPHSLPRFIAGRLAAGKHAALKYEGRASERCTFS